jgi:hypothetical protein
MKIKFLNRAILFVAVSFAIISCDKTQTPEAISNDDISYIQSDNFEDAAIDNISESEDNIIFNLDQSNYSTNTKKSTLDNVCYTISVDKADSTRFPKTITIDYGSGCMTVINGDTITKRGIITLVVTGRYYTAGATRTVTYNNFYINNIKIEGTRTIMSQGWDRNFNFSWTVTLSNGKLIFPDGTEVIRESDQTRTLVTDGTTDRTDDYWELTGTVSGVNYQGEAYTRETVSPLRKNFGCPFFVSGILDITRGDKSLSLDFGDGTCDRTATLTIGDQSKVITLKWSNK